MGIELSRETIYRSPEYDWENSLHNPSNRRDLGPFSDKTYEGAVDIINRLELMPAGELNRGKNRILKKYFRVVDIENFGKPEPALVRLGFAAEYSPNPDATGIPVPRAIVVRESRFPFDAEDFSDGVEGLFDYNDQSFKLPRSLRGSWTYGLAVPAGALIGGYAALFFTGDGAATAAAGAIGGYAGLKLGDYLYGSDQYAVKEFAPNVHEYFSNDKAMERLEKIAGHLDTVEVLKKIESSLKHRGVELSRQRISDIWRTDRDTGLGYLINQYNYWVYGEGAEDKGRMKTEFLNEMVDRVREVARNT